MNSPTVPHDPAGNRAASRNVWLYGALVLLLLVVQTALSTRRNVALEEIISITDGYYHLRTGSPVDIAQPPLMNVIRAAPLLFLNPEAPKIDGDVRNWSPIKKAMWASSFVYDNRVDAGQILFFARLPVIGMATLAGLILLLWVRHFYGNKAGMLALLLYVLAYNVFRPASLTANKFVYGAFLFSAAYLFWRNSRKPSIAALLGCAAALAAAVLTKASAIMFLPVAGVFTAALLWLRRFGYWEQIGFIRRIDPSRVRAKQAASAGISFAVLLLGVIGAVNASYLFEGSFDPVGRYDYDPEIYKLLPADAAVPRLIAGVYLNIPIPFPRPFIEQIKFERRRIKVKDPYPAGLDDIVGRLGNGYRSLAGSQLDLRHDLVYRMVNGYAAKLDLYIPRAKSKQPYPTMMYIHGGGWNSGNKESTFFSLIPYVARGMAIVGVGYRLARDSPAPAAVEDCRCALRWVFDNAGRYGLDVSRLAVAGDSSGGHLALMTGMLDSSDGYDKACGAGLPMKVSAIVNLYGATDLGDGLTRHDLGGDVARWLGDLPDRKAAARELSPLSHVRDGLPPILTIHGDADPSVPFDYAVRLHKALEKKNNPNELLTVPGGKHGDFGVTDALKIDETIEAFLKKHGVLP